MNLSPIAPGALLARVEDIADPGAIVVDVGERQRAIIITRAGAAIAAFHNRCPHAGYPLQRIATPDDIAGAILGLITGGDFVTGQTLLVDGGLSLS